MTSSGYLFLPEDVQALKYHDLLKKAACLFAGLGHLQPLLLATTNANYLLDRFCMERCCSSEYISRIVTSLIFMEILATLIVACLGAYMVFKKDPIWKNWGNPSKWLSWTGWSTNWSGATGVTLNNWTENEEIIRGYISSAIQCLISLGYIQILLAFTTGGKKGHMHWFYSSLMFQQFVCLLIGGAIGFWEGGVTLWYLMAIPMGPIPVFFYQLMIHSWIRNNGPRDVEYLVVEWQIGLALCLSILATLFWAQGYVVSYIPIELDIATKGGTTSSDPNRIIAGFITLQTATVKVIPKNSGDLPTIGLAGGVNVTVTLNSYSATLITVTEPGGTNNYAILTLTAELTILFGPAVGTAGNVTVLSANKGTGPPEIILNSPNGHITIKHVHPVVTVNKKTADPKAVDISLTLEDLRVTLESSQTITSVKVTIPVEIKITATPPVPLDSVVLTLPVPTTSPGTVETKNLTLSPPPAVNSNKTLNINVQATAGSAATGGSNAVQAIGTVFSPKKDYHCFYSVMEGAPGKKDIWAAGGGKCAFVACYKKSSNSNNGALLVLYLGISGGPLERKFFGRDTTDNDNKWYEITKAKFYEKLPALATQSTLSLSKTGTPTPQYNREFSQVLGPPSNPSATWAPLIMHGMAVGSFGSIFPNLIPKTLVCPKTSRTLTVVSIFLSPLPGIFNVMFADNGWPSAACAWTEWPSLIWQISWLLYLIYGLAFLFAIFNVHSPEWKLCHYIRSHGWMPFMMTLSITLIIEILIAIARAGIMMQRPANAATTKKDKNHPLLWNKIFCLMSLSYLPFWLTTTPMMKSYVSSLDPFLCDKDRDHWPTARYGAWRSGWYWCKCACRGLYTSPRKLITRDMRKALTRKDPKVYFLVTHDIPPEEWLWTSSSIIILMMILLTHWLHMSSSTGILGVHSIHSIHSGDCYGHL